MKEQSGRIADHNTPSISLFERLGFQVHKHMPIFGQTEYRMPAGMARTAASDAWARLQAEEAECAPAHAFPS